MRIRTKIPLLVLASLIAITGFPSLTTQQLEVPKTAKAANATVHEAKAYSILRLEEFNNLFNGKTKKYDHVGGEKVALSNFGYRIDGPIIRRRYFDKEGKASSKNEWKEIDLRKTMDGSIVEPEDMKAGKAKTPYRYYITYHISSARQKYSVHGGTDYEMYSTKPVTTCDTDSEGYPANRKKFNATQYKNNKKVSVTGTWYNFNAVDSQLQGIYSNRQGKRSEKVVKTNAAKSLWENTGYKINGNHYHVIVKIIDAKEFWEECCDPKSSSFRSYNGVMYMNPVKKIVEDKKNGWTKVIDSGLNTLAKYYDARMNRIDRTGKTCRNLKDEYNWKVVFDGPDKYDVTFEKYLCKSGDGIENSSYTRKGSNLFSSTTMKDALKPNCVFKVKNIRKTTIPDKDNLGNDNFDKAGLIKTGRNYFVGDTVYLKGIQVWQTYYNKKSSGKPELTQEFWIKDHILEDGKLQTTGYEDESNKTKQYSTRFGSPKNTFSTGESDGLAYSWGGGISITPKGEHQFTKNGKNFVKAQEGARKVNASLEGNIKKEKNVPEKSWTEIADYLENLWYKHGSGDMKIKLIYAPISKTGASLKIHKEYYNVSEDGTKYVRANVSSEDILISEFGKREAYQALRDNAMVGDKPLSKFKSNLSYGTLKPDGLMNIFATLAEIDKNKDKDKKSKTKTKTKAEIKRDAIEYIRASDPSSQSSFQKDYALCGYSVKYRVLDTDTGKPKSTGIEVYQDGDKLTAGMNKFGKKVINMVSNKVWDGKTSTQKKVGADAAEKVLGKNGIELKYCNFGTTGSGEDCPTITLYYFAPTTPITQIYVNKTICNICEEGSNGKCKHCGKKQYEVVGGTEIGTVLNATDNHAGGLPVEQKSDEAIKGKKSGFGSKPSTDTATKKSRVVMPEGSKPGETFKKVSDAEAAAKFAGPTHFHDGGKKKDKNSLYGHGFEWQEKTYTKNISYSTYCNTLTAGGSGEYEVGNEKKLNYVVEYYQKWVSTGLGTGYWTDDLSRPKIVNATWKEKVRFKQSPPKTRVVGQNTYTMKIPGYFGYKGNYLDQLKGMNSRGEFVTAQSGSENITAKSTGANLGLNEYQGRVNVVYCETVVGTEKITTPTSPGLYPRGAVKPARATLQVYYYGLDSEDGKIPAKEGVSKTNLDFYQKQVITRDWDKYSWIYPEAPAKQTIAGASVPVYAKSFAGYKFIPSYTTVTDPSHGSGGSGGATVHWSDGNEDTVTVELYYYKDPPVGPPGKSETTTTLTWDDVKDPTGSSYDDVTGTEGRDYPTLQGLIERDEDIAKNVQDSQRFLDEGNAGGYAGADADLYAILSDPALGADGEVVLPNGKLLDGKYVPNTLRALASCTAYLSRGTIVKHKYEVTIPAVAMGTYGVTNPQSITVKTDLKISVVTFSVKELEILQPGGARVYNYALTGGSTDQRTPQYKTSAGTEHSKFNTDLDFQGGNWDWGTLVTGQEHCTLKKSRGIVYSLPKMSTNVNGNDAQTIATQQLNSFLLRDMKKIVDDYLSISSDTLIFHQPKWAQADDQQDTEGK